MNPFEIEPVVDVEEEQRKARELKLAQAFAKERQPDAMARAFQVAQQQGVTVPAAEAAKPPEFSWDELRKTSPVLAKYLVDDLNRAAAIQDDVQNLSGFEKWFGGWQDMAWAGVDEYGRTMRMTERGNIGWRMVNDQGTAEDAARLEELDRQDAANPAVKMGYLPGIVPGTVQGVTQQLSAFSKHTREISQAAFAGGLTGAAQGMVAGPAGGGVGFARGFFAGAGAGQAAASMQENGVLEGGNAYLEYLKIPGVTEEQARASARFVAMANSAIEFLELDAVMGLVPGAKALVGHGAKDAFGKLLRSQTGRAALARFAGRVATIGLAEGFQEFAQEFVTIYEGIRAEGASSGEALARAFTPEMRERQLDSFVGGMQMAAGMGAANLAARTQADVREVRQSQERVRVFEALSDLAEGSKTRERLPEVLQEYVAKVQEQHGGKAPEAVSVPAGQLRQLLQTEGKDDAWLEKNLPEVAKQLRAAEEDEAVEVAIPLPAFAAHLAGLKGTRALYQDLRVGEGMTAREAKAAEQRSQDIPGEVEAEQGKAPEEKSPVVRVYEDVLQKSMDLGMDAEAARKPALLWASTMESRAARLAKDKSGKWKDSNAWSYYEGVGLQVEHTELDKAQLDAFNAARTEKLRKRKPRQDPDAPLKAGPAATGGGWYGKALGYLKDKAQTSITQLQNALGIRSDEAQDIMGRLEQEGVVGPHTEGQPRQVNTTAVTEAERAEAQAAQPEPGVTPPVAPATDAARAQELGDLDPGIQAAIEGKKDPAARQEAEARAQAAEEDLVPEAQATAEAAKETLPPRFDTVRVLTEEQLADVQAGKPLPAGEAFTSAEDAQLAAEATGGVAVTVSTVPADVVGLEDGQLQVKEQPHTRVLAELAPAAAELAPAPTSGLAPSSLAGWKFERNKDYAKGVDPEWRKLQAQKLKMARWRLQAMDPRDRAMMKAAWNEKDGHRTLKDLETFLTFPPQEIRHQIAVRNQLEASAAPAEQLGRFASWMRGAKTKTDRKISWSKSTTKGKAGKQSLTEYHGRAGPISFTLSPMWVELKDGEVVSKPRHIHGQWSVEVRGGPLWRHNSTLIEGIDAAKAHAQSMVEAWHKEYGAPDQHADELRLHRLMQVDEAEWRRLREEFPNHADELTAEISDLRERLNLEDRDMAGWKPEGAAKSWDEILVEQGKREPRVDPGKPSVDRAEAKLREAEDKFQELLAKKEKAEQKFQTISQHPDRYEKAELKEAQRELKAVQKAIEAQRKKVQAQQGILAKSEVAAAKAALKESKRKALPEATVDVTPEAKPAGPWAGKDVTIALVSCGSAKEKTTFPARLLYTGSLFKAQRRVAESADGWFILSARHHLVHPDTVLESYNNEMSKAMAGAWAKKVRAQLEEQLAGARSVHLVLLAGKEYADPLRAALNDTPWKLSDPLKGQQVGERLHTLKSMSLERTAEKAPVEAPAAPVQTGPAIRPGKKRIEIPKDSILPGSPTLTPAERRVKELRRHLKLTIDVLDGFNGMELNAQVEAEMERLQAEVNQVSDELDEAEAELAAERDGQVVDINGLQGNKGVLITKGTQEEPIVYAVVEADRVIPSHDPVFGFKKEKAYPEGVQERDYHSPSTKEKPNAEAEANRAKVTGGAKELKPHVLLSDDPGAMNGPPIVTAAGQDGRHLVMGGNGRTMMLHLAYAGEVKSRKAYREALIEKAKAFGVDPEEVRGMDRPVLVRILPELRPNSPKAQLQDAVRRTNTSTAAAMSASSLAVAESRMLSPQAIEDLGTLLAETEGTLRELLTSRPKEVIAVLQASNLITPETRAEWVEGHAIAPAAVDRIEGMFLGRIVGDGPRFDRTPKSIRQKLERIAPYLIRVEGVAPEASEIPTIQAALDKMGEAAALGVHPVVHSNTDDMFGEGATPPAVAAMVKVLHENGQRQIEQKFKRWAGLIGGDPSQGAMFAAAPADARTELLGKLPAGKVLFQRLGSNLERWAGKTVNVPELWQGGAPVRLYHATTHDFDRFDRSRANVENQHGRAFYFSSSPADASENYGHEAGDDLTQRVELRTEQLLAERGQNYEGEALAQAREQARRELVGSAPNVMPVFLRMENPVRLSPRGGTFLEWDTEWSEDGEEVVGESGKAVEAYELLRQMAEEYGADADGLMETLAGEGIEWSEGVDAWKLDRALHSAEELLDVTDENGDPSNANEFTRDLYERLGFDGIIFDADAAFGTGRKFGKAMAGVAPGTKHFIVWDATSIKSATGNRGTYDSTDRILYQGKKDPGPALLLDLKAAGNQESILAAAIRQEAKAQQYAARGINVVIPIVPSMTRSLAQFWSDVTAQLNVMGQQRWVAGVAPENALEVVRAVRPDRVHILAMNPRSKEFLALAAQLRAEHPTIEIVTTREDQEALRRQQGSLFAAPAAEAPAAAPVQAVAEAAKKQMTLFQGKERPVAAELPARAKELERELAAAERDLAAREASPDKKHIKKARNLVENLRTNIELVKRNAPIYDQEGLDYSPLPADADRRVTEAMTARRSPPPGWKRVDGGKDKTSAVWEHPSGWSMRHVGHPTANWPIILTSPAGNSVWTGATSGIPELGMGWRNFSHAWTYLEETHLKGWKAPPADLNRTGPQLTLWQGGAAITAEDAAVAMATSRAGGAVGHNALVPRLVREEFPKGVAILDFGAGKAAMHAKDLRDAGFDVTAYDLWGVPGVHDPEALTRKYAAIYASNVANVQNSRAALAFTLDQIRDSMLPEGRGILNLPATPRKGAFDGLTPAQGADLVELELRARFADVTREGGSTPVFRFGNPIATAPGPVQAAEAQAKAPAAPGPITRENALEGDQLAMWQRKNAEGEESYRGKVNFDEATRNWFRVTLSGKANLSTFLHESGHVFLELLRRDAAAGHAESQRDLEILEKWVEANGGAWSDDQLERFARGFEAYLREGRAPSSALAEAFASFKAWLTWIYRTVFALDVELTDEVRQVMDRLVATDEAIAVAQQDEALLPLFRDVTGEGDTTGLEYESIRGLYNAALEAGKAELFRESMRELRRHVGEEVDAARQAVSDELDRREDYNAWSWFTTGKLLSGALVEGLTAGMKLDLEAVKALGLPAQALRKLKPVLQVNGVSPDAAAAFLRFDTGDQLVRALADLPARGKLTEAMVTARMQEKYPGYTGSKAWFAENAQKAVNNEQLATALAAEIGILHKKVGGENARTLAKAIEIAARKRIAGMTVFELSPFRFRKAAGMAAVEKQRAWSEGNFQAAAQAARRQLWYLQLARLAQDAKDEVEKTRAYLDTFSQHNKRQRIGRASQAALGAIDKLLEGTDFKRRTAKALARRESLAEYLSTLTDEGAILSIPQELRDDAQLKSYQRMTVDEVRALRAAVANIDAQATLKNKLVFAKQRRELEATAQDVARQVRENLGTPFAEKKGDTQNPGWWAGRREWLRKGRAQLTKIEFICRVLDGGKTAGPIHQLIFQPLRDAEEAKFELSERMSKLLLEPFRKLTLKQRIRYYQRVDFLGTNMNLSEVLAVALNIGNESNLTKLVEGYAYRGWTREQVLQRVDELLTKEDWELVQHVWDSIDTLWPRIKELTERNLGEAPPRVEARQVVTRWGNYRGGYYPIAYDRRKLKQIVKDAGGNVKRDITPEQIHDAGEVWLSNNFLLPYVSKGFTEARTKYAAPLLLSLDLVPAHVNEVIHYLTHYEAVRAVDRLTQHPEVRKAIAEGMGMEMANLFRPWLQDIARDGTRHAVQDHVDSVLRHLRLGSSIVLLGMKWTVGLMQGLGLFPTMKELGVKWTAVGAKEFLAHLTEGNPFKEAEEESAEQRRLVKHFDREIGDFFDTTTSLTGLGKQAQRDIGALSLGLIIQVQRAVNTITWYAARAKALEEGHANPVGYADSVVAMTQSSAGMKDMAAIQRGPETKKLFTVMYTYYSVLFNQLSEGMGKKAAHEKALGMAVRWWWLVFLPVVIESMLRNKKPEPGDEEKLWKLLARENLLYSSRAIPLVGSLADAFASEIQFRNAPWLESMGRAAVAGGHMINPAKEVTRGDVRAATDFAGMVLHVPTGGLMNAARYLEAYSSGQLQEPVRDLLFRSPKTWE